MMTRTSEDTGRNLLSLALGAAAMYWLDPQSGRRRRAKVRDKLSSAANETRDAIGVTARDFRNRAHGVAARASRVLRTDEPGPEKLEARVRSELGYLCSHPSAIDVIVHDGRVELRGPVLKSEADQLVRGVKSVRGVSEVESHLEVHESADDVPALQGAPEKPRARFDFMQEKWSPTTRLLATAAGAALIGFGGIRRGAIGMGSSLLGLLALARGFSNLEVSRLTGVGAGRRAIELDKTLIINASVDDVFAFWESMENFPRFMTHVREVERVGDNRFRWCVEGPAGVPFQWDAEITQIVANKFLQWRSLPGSLVGNAGTIRFDPVEGGATRLTVRLAYNPPGGALGHAFAALLGMDPKAQMDDDLLRLKSLLEEGKTKGKEATVTRRDVQP